MKIRCESRKKGVISVVEELFLKLPCPSVAVLCVYARVQTCHLKVEAGALKHIGTAFV